MNPQVEQAIEFARRAESQPRVHGNGFIQLDVNDGQRLHFWGHPEIPRQMVPTPIHDHTFDLMSTVFIGRLFSITYQMLDQADGTHEIYQATPANPPQNQAWPGEDGVAHPEETLLAPTGKIVRPHIINTVVCGDGHSAIYRHPRGVFHESVAPGPAVSMMTKTYSNNRPPISARPRVLVRIGQQPDNAFRRDAHSEELLWRIIGELIA